MPTSSRDDSVASSLPRWARSWAEVRQRGARRYAIRTTLLVVVAGVVGRIVSGARPHFADLPVIAIAGFLAAALIGGVLVSAVSWALNESAYRRELGKRRPEILDPTQR